MITWVEISSVVDGMVMVEEVEEVEEVWPEMDEDKRIKAISRYANMLTYSTDILLVAFKDDADMAEELTEVVDRLCEILGLLGIGNTNEAERLNIELVKKIKNHVDCQSTT